MQSNASRSHVTSLVCRRDLYLRRKMSSQKLIHCVEGLLISFYDKVGPLISIVILAFFIASLVSD